MTLVCIRFFFLCVFRLSVSPRVDLCSACARWSPPQYLMPVSCRVVSLRFVSFSYLEFHSVESAETNHQLHMMETQEGHQKGRRKEEISRETPLNSNRHHSWTQLEPLGRAYTAHGVDQYAHVIDLFEPGPGAAIVCVYAMRVCVVFGVRRAVQTTKAADESSRN